MNCVESTFRDHLYLSLAFNTPELHLAEIGGSSLKRLLQYLLGINETIFHRFPCHLPTYARSLLPNNRCNSLEELLHGDGAVKGIQWLQTEPLLELHTLLYTGTIHVRFIIPRRHVRFIIPQRHVRFIIPQRHVRFIIPRRHVRMYAA